MNEIKVGDKVKIKYAGSQSWAVGHIGIVVPNDHSKYDYKVELEMSSLIRFLYLFENELEKV
jgi:hypothetical protein